MFLEFCETCDNEMYIKWHDESLDSLNNNPYKNDNEGEVKYDDTKYMILYCKKCANTKKLTRDDFIDENVINSDKATDEEKNEQKQKYSPLIYKKNYESETIDSRLFNNEFISEDRTLPFINDPKIKCPSCEDKTDILYQIYDQDNMKFLYTCKDCKTSWTIN